MSDLYSSIDWGWYFAFVLTVSLLDVAVLVLGRRETQPWRFKVAWCTIYLWFNLCAFRGCIDLYIFVFWPFGERRDGSSCEKIFLPIQVACVSSRSRFYRSCFFFRFLLTSPLVDYCLVSGLVVTTWSLRGTSKGTLSLLEELRLMTQIKINFDFKFP